MSAAAIEEIAERYPDEDVEFVRVPVGERGMIAREVNAAVEIAADGRNVEMLCVPYDRPVMVDDGLGPYREEFARGAFTGATKAPNRTLLEFEHWTPGLAGVIGHGAHFEERGDALYGRFRMGRNSDGDKALELIDEGVLTSASIFFEPKDHLRIGRDTIRRTRVMLDRVALCRVGAYPEARVLAVRTASVDETVEIPELARAIPFDPDLAARLEAAGLAVPPTLR
jgi:uncharacterized protein